MGNLLFPSAPERVFTVLLHQAFDSRTASAAELVYPAGGAIDAALPALPDRRVGFDLAGTPLGELPDSSYYATKYSRVK